MPVYTDTGQPLDATFHLDKDELNRNWICLIFNSCGDGQNTDYNAALTLLLERMGHLGGSLQRAEIETESTTHLSIDERLITIAKAPYPIDLAHTEHHKLRVAMGRSMADLGSTRKLGGGNRQKRIRLHLSFPLPSVDHHTLERRLCHGDPKDVLAGLRVSQGPHAVEDSPITLPLLGDGQGYSQDSARNTAVELQAMEIAEDYYRQRGWAARDVSQERIGTSRLGYDIECTKDARVLRVEVKGTTSKGESVFVTRNEVEQALFFGDDAVLFVVSNIRYDSGQASGGRIRHIIENWVPSDAALLQPTQFSLKLPSEPSGPG